MKRKIAALFMFMLLATAVGFGQVSVSLSPVANQQFLDSNGTPVVGGKLFTYITGTTTPLATYTDSTGTVQNANPIILDSSGRATIWLAVGSAYRFRLEDSLGNLIWQEDGVTSLSLANGGVMAGTFTGNPIFAGNPTFSGNPIFSGVPSLTGGAALSGNISGSPAFTGSPTVTGNGSGGNVALPVLAGQVYNIKAYGAVGDGVADDSAALTSAYTALPAAGGVIFFPAGTYKISSAYVFTKPVILQGVGRSSVIHYTPTTGTVFSFEQGTDPTGGFGAGARDLLFLGPGHSTSTVLFHVGGSTSATGAVGNYFLNTSISENQDNTTGFGTALETDVSGWGFATTIVNPDWQYCDTGATFYGEKNVIWGGILASNIHSVIVNPAADVHINAVSLDSDTGAYLVNHGGDVTVTGAHFETNNVTRSADGFVENGGRTTAIGGLMLDDTGLTSQPPFITDVYNAANGDAFVQALSWIGTSTQGDITGNYLVSSTGATSGGGMRGYINISPNNTGMSGIFDGVKPEQLTVVPTTNGPTSRLINFPSVSGTLVVQGANGVSAKTVTLAAGTATWTFATAYSAAPVCTATDNTAANAVRVEAPLAASVKVDGTTTDSVTIICTPAAN